MDPKHTSASALRSSLSDTLSRVSDGGERIIIEKNGKPAAALVSLADLELLETLEELDDIRALDERADEETLSLEEMKRRLGMA